MKTILVTGGAGAIGSRLVGYLCREHRVLVLDDLSSGWLENISGLPVKFWRGSIVDDEILKEVFAEKPDIVYHMAANFANQNSVDYPQKDLMVNGMGTLKVLQYSNEIDVERFIYTSSSCVYGNIDEPISEEKNIYSLDTPYAVTKYLGEQYVSFYHEHHAMPTVIVRLFNSYGPGEYPGKYRNVVPNFMYRCLMGQPLIITGSGNETRDFTFIDDTVKALMLAITHPDAVGKKINIGSGAETSILELAERIRETCKVNVPIEHGQRRDWDSVNRRCADITLAKETLGYMPTVDLSTGLKQTHEWFVKKKIVEVNIL